MSRPFQLDLISLQYTLSAEFEEDAREYFLFEPFTHDQILQFYQLKGLSSVLVSIARYRLGKILNEYLERYEPNQHTEWALDTFSLSGSQNRRLRRHARNISERISHGEQLRDLVKLPTLSIRGAKSRKDRAVEQNLDALRSFRGDLQDKIVKK